MATVITGLKISQLDTLALGATGTRFLVSSSNANSYQMYEKDLYTTLYMLHLSGAFPSKTEDWRFVHVTGDEAITGNKRFYNDITGNNIDLNAILRSGNSFIDISNQIIYTSPTTFANLGSRLFYDDNDVSGIKFTTLQRYLIDQSGNIALDWNNRILSGNWNVTVNPTINNQSVVTGNRVVMTSGNQHISGQKDFHGDVNFYNQHYGFNVLTFRSGIGGYINLNDNSGVESINANTREARNTSNQIVAKWGNTILTGVTPYTDGVYGTTYVNNINWDNGMLNGGWVINDTTGQASVHALYRVLVNEHNIATIDWGNIFGFSAANLRDNNGTIAMYWPLRQLIASNGSTVSLDWNTNSLSGNWNAQNLTIENKSIITGIGTSGYLPIFIANGSGISNSNIFSHNGSLCVGGVDLTRVFNVIGDVNIAEELYCGAIETPSLNDSSHIVSVNPNTRVLTNTATTTSLDWQNRVLSGHWTGQRLVLTDGIRVTGINISSTGLFPQSIDINGDRYFQNNLDQQQSNYYFTSGGLFAKTVNTSNSLLRLAAVELAQDASYGKGAADTWIYTSRIGGIHFITNPGPENEPGSGWLIGNAYNGEFNSPYSIGSVINDENSYPLMASDASGHMSLLSKLFLDFNANNFGSICERNHISGHLNVTGITTLNQLQSLKTIISGSVPSTPTSQGISGQIATSGQKFFICTGQNLWGYLNITPW